VTGLAATYWAVTVRVTIACCVCGELGEEALPVTLADAGGAGQAGAGRGLPGRQLRLVGRSHPRTSTDLPKLLDTGRLGCGLVAWCVRLCGFLAGLEYGHGLGQARRPAAPADLLHQQVGGEHQRDRGHGEHQPRDRPARFGWTTIL
jgi:hypothetical protein